MPCHGASRAAGRGGAALGADAAAAPLALASRSARAFALSAPRSLRNGAPLPVAGAGADCREGVRGPAAPKLLLATDPGGASSSRPAGEPGTATTTANGSDARGLRLAALAGRRAER